MKTKLFVGAAFELILCLPDIAYAIVQVNDVVPPYANQIGNIRTVDRNREQITIDGTSYSYDAKEVTIRATDNGVTGIQAVQPGMLVGYTAKANAKTGKIEISEIWILKATPAKK